MTNHLKRSTKFSQLAGLNTAGDLCTPIFRGRRKAQRRSAAQREESAGNKSHSPAEAPGALGRFWISQCGSPVTRGLDRPTRSSCRCKRSCPDALSNCRKASPQGIEEIAVSSGSFSIRTRCNHPGDLQKPQQSYWALISLGRDV